MKILGRIYHFMLFLLMTWTVYNSFIFVCLLLPPSVNEYMPAYQFDFWNFYLLGAVDFHKFISDLAGIFGSLLNERVRDDLWPFFLYSFLVTGFAFYIWCSSQNPRSACFLAIAHCIAGPYICLVFVDYRFLFFGIIGIMVFYLVLNKLNNDCKKYYPDFALPTWLEWRMPGLVPSLKPLTDKISRQFNKFSRRFDKWRINN